MQLIRLILSFSGRDNNCIRCHAFMETVIGQSRSMDKSWLVQLTTVSMRFEWASQLETAGNDNFSFDREEARLRLVRFVRITLPVLIKVRAISRKVSSVKYVVSGKQREFPIERERETRRWQHSRAISSTRRSKKFQTRCAFVWKGR